MPLLVAAAPTRGVVELVVRIMLGALNLDGPGLATMENFHVAAWNAGLATVENFHVAAWNAGMGTEMAFRSCCCGTSS